MHRGDSSALWTWQKKTPQFVATPLKRDLGKFCSVANFAPDGPRFVHFCFIEEGSVDAAQGMSIGGPCCRSRDESVKKIHAAVYSITAGRAWKVATDSRWTAVPSSLRRFCLANANANILTRALRELKTHWGLNPELAASLARAIAANASDFPARNKLRLLRIVEGFSEDGINSRAAIATIVSSVCDELLFHILGGPQKPRASLRTLLDPEKSPVVQCQATLLELLSSFGGGSEEAKAEAETEVSQRWGLLFLMGGSARDATHRYEARRTLLQLSAGVTDVMELRFSRPPYNLCQITFGSVLAGDKTALVDRKLR